MDQLAALDRLIEGIDKDEWGDRKIPAFGRFLRFCADSGLQDHHIAAWDANEGCLNSVFALHNTLLPGWKKNVGFIEFADGAVVCTIFGPLPETANKWDFSPKFDAEASSPARAWLLAILRAYRATIAQESNND